MALTKYKLGELIQIEDERNSDGRYSLDDVKGISIQKIFIETKADMKDVSLTPYILVKPDFFGKRQNWWRLERAGGECRIVS